MNKTSRSRIREFVFLIIAVLALSIAGLQAARAAGPETAGTPTESVLFQNEGDDANEAIYLSEGEDSDEDIYFAGEGDYYANVAEVIGVDIDTLYSELDSGNSLAEIATAHDVDPQLVIDVLVAESNTFVDELEQAGEISAEEAAEWRAETVAFVTFEVNTVYPDAEKVAAETIGISLDALWAELDADKTIAEVATANGVDVQTVIDAAVSAENAYVDAMLAAGLLDEAEATEWKAENIKFVTDLVNNTQVAWEDDFDEAFGEDDEEIHFDEGEGDYYANVAEVIGVDIDTLYSELDSGNSLAEIATANGVDLQLVIDVLVAETNTIIDKLEQANEISAEEAAEWRAETVAFVTFEVNTVYPNAEKVAAETIGISLDALWAEIDAGKTIAEVAIANGVDVQTVIDAAVSAENAYVDAMLAAGLLDEADAVEWKAENITFVTDLINNTQQFWEADFADIEFSESVLQSED